MCNFTHFDNDAWDSSTCVEMLMIEWRCTKDTWLFEKNHVTGSLPSPQYTCDESSLMYTAELSALL